MTTASLLFVRVLGRCVGRMIILAANFCFFAQGTRTRFSITSFGSSFLCDCCRYGVVRFYDPVWLSSQGSGWMQAAN